MSFKDEKEALEHFTKLATDAGLPEDQVKAVAAALKHEAFGKQVAKGFMLEADYSKNKGELAKERKAIEKEYAEYYGKLNEWAKGYNSTVEDSKRVLDEYRKYVETYGALDKPAKPNGTEAGISGLSLEQLKTLLEEHGKHLSSNVSSFVRDAIKLSSDYQRKFGEPMDVDAFEQHLDEVRKADPQAAIKDVYQSWIAPRLEERQKTALEERIKREREQAVQEYASTHKVPVDTGTREYSPAWDPQRHERAKLSGEEQAERATDGMWEAWNKAAQESRA